MQYGKVAKGRSMKVMGLVGMLSICSVEDLWKRQIHLVVISAFGILGVLLHFL